MPTKKKEDDDDDHHDDAHRLHHRHGQGNDDDDARDRDDQDDDIIRSFRVDRVQPIGHLQIATDTPAAATTRKVPPLRIHNSTSGQ